MISEDDSMALGMNQLPSNTVDLLIGELLEKNNIRTGMQNRTRIFSTSFTENQGCSSQSVQSTHIS
jgi:predicted transcriptional regulator